MWDVKIQIYPCWTLQRVLEVFCEHAFILGARHFKLLGFNEQKDDTDFLRGMNSLPLASSGTQVQVYSNMAPSDANNYEKLNNALLKRYKLTADGFHQNLRENQLEVGETAFQ